MPPFQTAVAAALTAGLLLATLGCASYYESTADREGARIQAEKLAEVERFRREELIDPRLDEVPVVPEEVDLDLPDPMTLDDAIRIATERNRDYKSRREDLFLSSLSLGLTRRDFLRPVFDAGVSWALQDGDDLDYSDVTALSFGGSYLFWTGAEIRLDTSVSMSNDSGVVGPDQLTLGSARVSIDQPLLQGAGHDIAFETLTQAERSLLYDARAFELFRQDFVIDITDDYFSLLSQKRQLANTRQNIERQQYNLEQAEALFSIGEGEKLDVFRAEQSLFGAQNNLLADEQSYRVSFDRFKIQLGLPIAAEFDIDDEFPEINELAIDTGKIIEAALNNRLDLLTQREQVEDIERAVMIARNSLRPRFDLSASYTKNTDAETSLAGLDFDEEIGTLGLALEIPLDRKPQRNAYRAALISLDQSKRNLQRFEDDIILEVRSSIGSLVQRRTQIEIGKKEIESLELSREKAQLEVEQGSATNRDLTEALDDLTRANNQQLDRVVDHEIARLTLLRQVGLLFVDESGRVEP